MNQDRQNNWKTLYQAALLELNPAKLPERIDQAFRAIEAYMETPWQSSNAQERQALADAWANLRVLRREIAPISLHEDIGPRTKIAGPEF